MNPAHRCYPRALLAIAQFVFSVVAPVLSFVALLTVPTLLQVDRRDREPDEAVSAAFWKTSELPSPEDSIVFVSLGSDGACGGADESRDLHSKEYVPFDGECELRRLACVAHGRAP
jgi:hypothetical protein